MSDLRRIKRMSLDLEAAQHAYAKMFALQNDINVSVLMRAMLFRLETDAVFANEIIDLIFSVPEEEVTDAMLEGEEAAAPEQAVTVKIADLKPGSIVYDAEGKEHVVG